MTFQRTQNPIPVAVRAFIYPAGTILRVDDLIDDPPWSPVASEEDPLEDVSWDEIPGKVTWIFDHNRRGLPRAEQEDRPRLVRARREIVMWEFDVLEELVLGPKACGPGPVKEHFRESPGDIARFYPDLYELVQAMRNPPPVALPAPSDDIFSIVASVVPAPKEERSPYDPPDTVQFVAVFDAEVWCSGPSYEGEYDSGVELELLGQLDFNKLARALLKGPLYTVEIRNLTHQVVSVGFGKTPGPAPQMSAQVSPQTTAVYEIERPLEPWITDPKPTNCQVEEPGPDKVTITVRTTEE